MDDVQDSKDNKSTDELADLKENLIKSGTNTQQSPNLVQEGIIAGKKIAKTSVITLLAIGIVEIITGILSGSVVATADGLDSISDAAISFIVLLGLRIAHRPADKKFHFGYHKVESFTALIASIGMIVIGLVIFYIPIRHYFIPMK